MNLPTSWEIGNTGTLHWFASPASRSKKPRYKIEVCVSTLASRGKDLSDGFPTATAIESAAGLTPVPRLLREFQQDSIAVDVASEE